MQNTKNVLKTSTFINVEQVWWTTKKDLESYWSLLKSHWLQILIFYLTIKKKKVSGFVFLFFFLLCFVFFFHISEEFSQDPEFVSQDSNLFCPILFPFTASLLFLAKKNGQIKLKKPFRGRLTRSILSVNTHHITRIFVYFKIQSFQFLRI